MEDSRFREVPSLKKKNIPHQLHWFLEEDYFSNEICGLNFQEIEKVMRLTVKAFDIFEEATEKILKEKSLHKLGIPKFFESCIYHSWEQRNKHPFLTGRFDVNGTLDGLNSAIIEFNADTFSTLPETILWQAIQLKQYSGNHEQFNNLDRDLIQVFQNIARQFSTTPVLLGSSLGYREDVLNVNCMLDIAHRAGFRVYYLDLEHVVFSEEGIFINQDDEYIKVDVWYKMVPWDWMFMEEPDLARLLSQIIIENQAIVLNPPYTTIWQNKLFLAYITQHFPNDVIAKTYADQSWNLNAYVKKPIYGRVGENILLKDEAGKEIRTQGDYADQPVVYQQYLPLPKDSEKYYYQIGMFYTDKPSALNLRAQDSKILNDDCEFMTHYLMPRF